MTFHNEAPLLNISTGDRSYIDTLLSCLNQSKDPLSFPMRYILTLHLNGTLQTRTEVFADYFPNWNLVGVAYDTEAFTGLVGGHWHVICHVRAAWRTALHDQEVAAFVCAMVDLLELHQCGFFLVALPELFKQKVLEKLQQCFGIECKVIGNHVTVVYETDQSQLASIRQGLPAIQRGHTLDRLRVDDVPFIVSEWFAKDVFEDVSKWFEWLIKHMPSVCIRGEDSLPISWNVDYEFGAGGTKIRDSTDHRCHAYARLICFYRSLQALSRFPQLPNYGHMLATNTAAFKSVRFMIREVTWEEPVCFLIWNASGAHSAMLQANHVSKKERRMNLELGTSTRETEPVRDDPFKDF